MFEQGKDSTSSSCILIVVVQYSSNKEKVGALTTKPLLADCKERLLYQQTGVVYSAVSVSWLVGATVGASAPRSSSTLNFKGA